MTDDRAPGFVGTNVMVYAFDNTDSPKKRIARRLLDQLMDENRGSGGLAAHHGRLRRDRAAAGSSGQAKLSFRDALAVVAAARSGGAVHRRSEPRAGD